MGDGTRLVKTIQTITRSPVNNSTDFVLGTVITTKPLVITVGTLTLTEKYLMLSPFCVETKINLNHSHTSTGTTGSTDLGSHNHNVTISGSTYGTTDKSLGSHSHSVNLTSEDGLGIVTLWRGLKSGDNVLMLKGMRGQKYYVLQRQEGIGN